MSNGKHSVPRNWHMHKTASFAIAVVLVMLVSIGGTLAWRTEQSKPVHNTFTAGKADIDIDETVEHDIKKSVTVKNTGTAPVYVRVAVVINCRDQDGNILFGEAPEFVLNSAKWTLLGDGYYYYNGIVAPETSTEELLGKPFDLVDKDGNQYEMDVLAEAIQAGGSTASGTPAVEDAWHAKYDGSTWTPVPPQA